MALTRRDRVLIELALDAQWRKAGKGYRAAKKSGDTETMQRLEGLMMDSRGALLRFRETGGEGVVK